MDKNVYLFINKQVEKVIDSLGKNNMKGIFVKDEDELIEDIHELVEENSVVGVGDSTTLQETGMLDFLRGNLLGIYLEKYRYYQ